jgi:hypothetical protein
LLLISVIFVSLIAISAVSAADNVSDSVAVSDDSNVIAVDNDDEIVNVNADESSVAAEDADEIVSVDADKDIVSAESSSDSLKINFSGSSSRSSGSFNFSSIDFGSLFNGTTISFGNGTSFNFTDLFNGNSTFSFGNGTSFNISDLLNGTFSFGNGTNSSFDFSSILNIFGGTTETINATDMKKVYTTNTKFSVNILKGNETLTSGAVIFTVDNKEYAGSWDGDVVSVNLKNLKPGDHFIMTEYGQILAKNKITVSKATPKLTAKKQSFQS